MGLISDEVKTAILLATSGFLFLITIYPRNKLKRSFSLRSIRFCLLDQQSWTKVLGTVRT